MKKKLFGKTKVIDVDTDKVIEKKPQRPEPVLVTEEKKLDIPDNLTGEERKRALVTKANELIKDVCAKYGCNIGVWMNRKSLVELTNMFDKNPGIELYRLDSQLRID